MSEVTQNTYWKSLNQLAQNQEYQEFVDREFPENATELKDGVSRKSFLRIMGASIALAGFAACRRPVQKILPYSKQPEDIVPGVPLFYASAMPFMGSLTGLVIENHEGRPTKVEGNELHPGSMGKTNAYHQASMLEMYDPDRSHYPKRNGSKSSVNDFVAFAKEYFDSSKKVAFVSEANSSPTLSSLKSAALKKFENAKWVTYEPFGEENMLEGNKLAFGSRLRTHINYSEADIVVSIDDDFLSATHPNNVEYAYNVTAKRKVTSTSDEMSRIYAVENGFTLTGAYADHRLKVKASEIPAFVNALAAALSEKVSGLDAFSGLSNKFSGEDFLHVLVEELASHKGKSAISAGLSQSADVHAVVAAINTALANNGKTVNYLEVPFLGSEDNNQAFKALISDMKSGTYDAVFKK